MRERIIKFLEKENISASVFADEIGVQRSSVSHILSGRNNPSFEFIQKILTRYKNLNAEWLILGTGNMYKSIVQKSINFDNNQSNADGKNIDIPLQDEKKENDDNNLKVSSTFEEEIEQIILLYKDKTFKYYYPVKQ